MTCKIAGLFFYCELCIAKRSKTPHVEALFPPSGDVMIYTILSLVFITIAFLLGTWSFFGFLERWRLYYSLTWKNYKTVIILASIAAFCFILAVIFGIQIPDCYAR